MIHFTNTDNTYIATILKSAALVLNIDMFTFVIQL